MSDKSRYVVLRFLTPELAAHFTRIAANLEPDGAVHHVDAVDVDELQAVMPDDRPSGDVMVRIYATFLRETGR